MKDHYKIIIKNIEKCQKVLVKINGEEVTENKNLKNTVYILINEKEEENLLKEDLDELEDMFYYDEDDGEDNDEEDDGKDNDEEDINKSSESGNKYEYFH